MKLFRTSGLMMGMLLLAGLFYQAQELVRVSRVVDADTYEIIRQSRPERVRLLHVDAPETGQPFGLAATDSVRALLAAAPLVELTTYGADLYGRTLGAVRVGLARHRAACGPGFGAGGPRLGLGLRAGPSAGEVGARSSCGPRPSGGGCGGAERLSRCRRRSGGASTTELNDGTRAAAPGRESVTKAAIFFSLTFLPLPLWHVRPA